MRTRDPARRESVGRQGQATRQPAAPCWCPFRGRRLRSDNEHFEALTAALFCARFNPEIVRRRWPAIRESFAGFDLAAVASWPEEDADRLMHRPGMIRNRKKIVATLRNARELAQLAARYGAVETYLRAVQGSRLEPAEAIDRWVHYIGVPSIRCYLACAGFDHAT